MAFNSKWRHWDQMLTLPAREATLPLQRCEALKQLRQRRDRILDVESRNLGRLLSTLESNQLPEHLVRAQVEAPGLLEGDAQIVGHLDQCLVDGRHQTVHDGAPLNIAIHRLQREQR